MTEFYFGQQDTAEVIDIKQPITDEPIEVILTSSEKDTGPLVGIKYNKEVFGRPPPEDKDKDEDKYVTQTILIPSDGVVYLREMGWGRKPDQGLTYLTFSYDKETVVVGSKSMSNQVVECNCNVTLTGVRSNDKHIYGLQYSYNKSSSNSPNPTFSIESGKGGKYEPIGIIAGKRMSLYGKRSFSGMQIGNNTYGNVEYLIEEGNLTVATNNTLHLYGIKLGSSVLRGIAFIPENCFSELCHVACGERIIKPNDDEPSFLSVGSKPLLIRIKGLTKGVGSGITGGIRNFQFVLL